jgi:hypothetical protein
MRATGVLLLMAAACAGGRHDLRPPDDVDDPSARADLMAAALEGYSASYVLTWNGARIGEAHEKLVADAQALGGWRFERDERVTVRRGGVVAEARTAITIDLDEALTARRVLVDRWAGPTRTRGEAIRLVDETWRVEVGSAAPRLVEGNAVPATLVPLLVAAGGAAPGRAFEQPVLVEGAGLAVARLAIDVSDDRRTAHARLSTAAGELAAEAALDDRGFLAAAGGDAGVASRRVPEAELEASFDAPEIVDSAAVLVGGAGDLRPGAPLHLRVEGVAAAPRELAEIAHQRVTSAGGAWDVSVDPVALRRRDPDIREVTEETRHVASTLIDDLAVASLAPDEALAAGRGDCTAHAVVLQKLLADRGYEARLVTGYVLDDGALRRHRWVVVRVHGDWVAVDPMYDEVPASPAHLALAVHGSSMDELAFIDDVAFAGWESATATLAR